MSANFTTARHLVPNLSIRQISIILTIIAFALWSYSITLAKLEIGFFGLIHSLHVLFFVALAVLTIASGILWSSPRSESKLLFLQLCLLIVSLWLTPIITGGTQPFIGTPYWLWGHSEYVMRESHFAHPALSNLWYHNWPGAIIFFTTISLLGGINSPDTQIQLAPFFLQFTLLPLLYLFLRNTLGKNKKNYIWVGLWIFELGSWTAYTYYLSPPAVAYMLFLYMLVVLTWSTFKLTKASVFGTRLGNIIVLASLAVTHLLTNLVVVAVVFVLQIFRRVKAWNLLTIGIVFAVAWTLYGAVSFFLGNVPGFLLDAFRIDRQFLYGIIGRISGNESHQAIAFIRIVTVAIFLGMAAFGYLFSRRQKIDISTDRTVLAIAAGTVVGIGSVGGGYGFELVMRVFFFMLPAIAYFSVKLLDSKLTSIILCLLLLILLPMHFVSHYGNQDMDYLSPSHLSGLHFFEEYTSGGTIIGGQPLGCTKNTENYGRVDTLLLAEREQLEWDKSQEVYKSRDWGELGTPTYVCISDRNKRADDFWFNEPQFTEAIERNVEYSEKYNAIYASRDIKLYLRDRPK